MFEIASFAVRVGEAISSSNRHDRSADYSDKEMSSSPSITSLLDSLHTHLQSQTQLLPTLHAQLGLPPTALADELSALQQTLTQCVEDQIDGRRKQVNEWTAKCEEVEEECQRYGIALGSHIKGAGPSSTMGEAHKEQVLPKRHEKLTEMQEKLRQLYHTKLERLLTLTNRITALSRMLGEGFFPEDVLEPKLAGARNLLDTSTHRDVTPERFSVLEKELVRGKGEVTKRLAQLSSTFVQIDWLYTELGIVPPSVSDFSPHVASTSSLHMSTFSRPSTARCSTSDADPFLSVSTPTPGSRTRPLTPALFLATEPDSPETPHELVFARRIIGLDGVEPTPGLLAWADALLSELEETKCRRETRIQAMFDQLEGLWRRLGVSDADMDGFVEAHRGSTEVTEQAYDEELERMLELKRERMGTFIQNARDEIDRLWEELMVGAEERADFAPFSDDQHTEELLILHEEEIKRLKDERRMKAHLLGSIRKYLDICEEEKDLAAAASDQNRLLGRGPRDPGRLLREEKMRKRVRKEKPRLAQDLLASIPAWEAETGRPFLIRGESMLQILLEATSLSADKENAKRKSGQRAGSVPLRATTPSNPEPIYGYGHTGGKRSVTPAVRPASSQGTHSRPNKRPRLGDATSSYGNATVPRGRAAPSTGLAMPVPKPAASLSTSTSSLPRPRALAAPRTGIQHHSLGHDRMPSTAVRNSGRAHTSAAGQRGSRQAPRAVSASAAGVYRSAGGPLNSVARPNPQMLARKASRARRESFKPRPSVNGPWALPRPTAGKHGGFDGVVVKEEEEDY
ncbi:hypothetical protein EW146_g8269 [Bondarzewia mesenterica]|uniref:Uncharacterized protein n=2 Tax=Bondarzewia mesenterica TaxID=1095465 RepID=A0A4S4LHK6_9AGAM|nr:hypothetical protein EW146_g8269 [Bondarzewia mesenterica]